MTALAARQREFMRTLFAGAPPPSAGLAIYRGSVTANLVAALEATYPVVRRLVGAPFFGEAARRFSMREPSASGDLGAYGGGFASFLAAYPPAASLDYLPDVARLEWACHECARAPDAPGFDFASLARVDARDYDALTLLLHPSVRLVASAHPIAAIHAANAPECDGTPLRANGPDHVVVWRGEAGMRVETVPAHEWDFLERISLGEALGAAAQAVPRDLAESFLATALARYVSIGIVCEFTGP